MKDELLVRAAQANGHAYPWTMPNGFGERPWNPLTNNEDALVLAVRIGLQVTAYPMYDEPKHSVIVRKPVWDHDAQESDGVEVVEPYGTDALAATRRAITMCAAELARRKTPKRQVKRRRHGVRLNRQLGISAKRNAMHTGYKELDDAIIAHLEREPWRHPIYVESLARVAARELGRGDLPHGDDKEWRLIDRRLQALRKAGRIRHVRETGLKPRWEVCDA